jgi:hypothetical protein
MELVSERLIKGEEIIVNGVVSNGIYWKAIAVFIFAVILAIFFAFELGVFFALVAVLTAIYAIIMKEILTLVVTNKRILVRYGILQVDIVDIHFDKVESVELARMLPGYLLGYSNVVIMGTGSRVIVMPYFENGVEIRRAFNEMTLNRSASLPPQPVVIVNEKPAG